MADDVLHDLVVAPEPAALEARLRPRAVQLRRLQEAGVLGGVEQRGRVAFRGERSPRLDVDHARVEDRPAEVARDGDAMVAVDHVVLVVDLVDVDRRQLVALDHRLVDPCPPVPLAPVEGQKAWGRSRMS